MVVVNFIENRTVVLTQLRNQAPLVDEEIKIKGRKGKVLSLKEMEENIIRVHVYFEPIIKKQLVFKDDKKRRR
mgnify:FL=1